MTLRGESLTLMGIGRDWHTPHVGDVIQIDLGDGVFTGG